MLKRRQVISNWKDPQSVRVGGTISLWGQREKYSLIQINGSQTGLSAALFLGTFKIISEEHFNTEIAKLPTEVEATDNNLLVRWKSYTRKEIKKREWFIEKKRHHLNIQDHSQEHCASPH